MGAAEPADAAAQRQAGDAGCGDHTTGGCQAKRLRFSVEVSPRHARLGACSTSRGVNPDALHERKVEHESAVADAAASDTVTAAAHRQNQVMVAGKVDGADDIGNARTTDD